MENFDKVIIGAGIFGLYSALYTAERGQKVLVLEYDNEAFSRASYINQARVHNGYHYPRSLSTAISSAKYFEKFNKYFGFCVNEQFDKIYATSKSFSFTNAEAFKKFSEDSNILCEKVDSSSFLNTELIDGAFKTKEYSLDAKILKDFFIQELSKFKNAQIIYNSRLKSIDLLGRKYNITLKNKKTIETNFILNATYGSINQVLNIANKNLFDIKYELCEIVLCEVSKEFEAIGITIMDGPFFSLMPFGKSNLHSLSSVTFTPHKTSYESLPKFKCQEKNTNCSPKQLSNCNLCPQKPKTNWANMHQIAKKYLKQNIKIKYVKSLYAIKAILNSSEINDSRPTIIREHSADPYFYSVLSGKINTIFDLDKILD
jgi:hypothetical protein